MSLNYEDIIVWTYSIVGTLFLFYFFTIFIQRRIERTIRLGLSSLFLLTGTLFFAAAGNVLTGYESNFSVISIVIAIMLAVTGLAFVYVLYREVEKKEHYEIK